jgi:PhzF family phenazine biosynthesis protein
MTHGDLPLFLIDAFASAAFTGNPAAVVLELQNGVLDDPTRRRIAAEMNQSETAFVSAAVDAAAAVRSVCTPSQAQHHPHQQ